MVVSFIILGGSFNLIGFLQQRNRNYLLHKVAWGLSVNTSSKVPMPALDAVTVCYYGYTWTNWLSTHLSLLLNYKGSNALLIFLSPTVPSTVCHIK